MVKHRSAWTPDEITELREIVRELRTVPRDRQRRIRDAMRGEPYRFWISDFFEGKGFTVADLDRLVEGGAIVVFPG
jgi:hypothetical protein